MLNEISLDAWMTALPGVSLHYQNELERRLSESQASQASQQPSMLSTYKLAASYVAGVKRKDGIPYINHPLRLAMTLEKCFGPLWPKQWIEQLQIIALFHDALEEGPGVTQATHRRLSDDLAAIGIPKHEAPWLAGTAVILTEPEFKQADMVSVPKKHFYLLRKGAMAYQASHWTLEHWSQVDPKRSALILATALTDKLTNLFDLDYLLKDKSKTQTEIMAKIQTTFFYHSFCLGLYENAIHKLLGLNGSESLWTSHMQPLVMYKDLCKQLLLKKLLSFGWSSDEFFGPSNPLTRYWGEHHAIIIKNIETNLFYLK